MTRQPAKEMPAKEMPAKEMLAKDVPAVESLALTQQAMFAHLGMRSFDLTRGEGQGQYIQTTPQLIALYGSAGRKGVYAVGLLDCAACCLIGGLAAGCSAQEIRASQQQGRPAPQQIEQASRFMRAMAPLLKKRAPSDGPSFNAARLSSQPAEKLAHLIANNAGRSDFLVHINGMGLQADARLSFMLA